LAGDGEGHIMNRRAGERVVPLRNLDHGEFVCIPRISIETKMMAPAMHNGEHLVVVTLEIEHFGGVVATTSCDETSGLENSSVSGFAPASGRSPLVKNAQSK
jgi:hypothetical protein